MTLYVAFVWTCPHQERRNTWLLWGKAAQSLYYTIRFTRCTAALHVVSRTTESGTRARVGVNSSGVGGARDWAALEGCAVPACTISRCMPLLVADCMSQHKALNLTLERPADQSSWSPYPIQPRGMRLYQALCDAVARELGCCVLCL